MIGDEGVHRHLRPGWADAVGEVEGPSDLAAEAVDVEGDAADRRVGDQGACSWAAIPS